MDQTVRGPDAHPASGGDPFDGPGDRLYGSPPARGIPGRPPIALDGREQPPGGSRSAHRRHDGGEQVLRGDPGAHRGDGPVGGGVSREPIHADPDGHPLRLPVAPAGRGLTLQQRLRRRVGLALAGAGLVEVLTYPFMGDVDADALGIAPDAPERPRTRLANPLSETEPYLRSVLLAGLAAAARRNLARGTADFAIFEWGSTFRGTCGAPGVRLGTQVRPTSEQWDALQASLPEQGQHLAAAGVSAKG